MGPIRQLRFSPCKLLLISCAEQLCFWNVTHMRNNQGEQRPNQSRSRRIKLHSVPHEDAVDAAPIASDSDAEPPSSLPRQSFADSQREAELWLNKRGNADRPELLACIKFVGNEASQFFTDSTFSKFYVIDDEGVYYHLMLLDPSRLRLPEQSLEKITDRSLDQIGDLQYEEYLRIIESPASQTEESEGADVVGDLVLDKNSKLDDIDLEPPDTILEEETS